MLEQLAPSGLLLFNQAARTLHTEPGVWLSKT
jgi:hypothetical protein